MMKGGLACMIHAAIWHAMRFCFKAIAVSLCTIRNKRHT